MLVVFDLDGTLIDSIGDIAVAVNQLVSERGGRALALADVSRMVGEGANLLLSRAFDAAGVPGDSRDALSRYLEIYDGVLPGQTRPYPGIPEMLSTLGGVVPLAVLTNKPIGAARKILSLFDLEKRFLRVVGGDGPFRRKPGPDGLWHLMDEAGADPAHTLMVGDSTVDLLTAHAAGTRACIVRYGFGFANFDHQLLRGGEVLVDRPDEIAALVLERARAG